MQAHDRRFRVASCSWVIGRIWGLCPVYPGEKQFCDPLLDGVSRVTSRRLKDLSEKAIRITGKKAPDGDRMMLRRIESRCFDFQELTREFDPQPAHKPEDVHDL